MVKVPQAEKETRMTTAPPSPRSRTLPLLALVAMAITLAVMFRDQLSFDALAENRESLLAYRNAHYGKPLWPS